MLTFQLMPTIVPPLIEHSSKVNTIVNPGDDVVLVCRANGRPTPSLIWTYNDAQINAGPRHVISGDQLEIKEFKNSDQGSYSCIANNKLGLDRRTFTVFIKSKLFMHHSMRLPLY